jgi:signal recognition particle subunit SRP54
LTLTGALNRVRRFDPEEPMLETLSRGFRTARNRLRGFSVLNERNIDDAIREIRISLLEADVEYHVVKRFLERVKEKALGEIVRVKAKSGTRVTPGDHFVKICNDELEALMGPVDTSLSRSERGFTTIMMVGLQGSGKTTTCAKLATLLKSQGKKPMLVAADVYRPAAVEQLRVLGERIEVPVFAEPGVMPPALATKAVGAAGQQGCDTVIVDTAGRLAIDDTLMTELEDMRGAIHCRNVFLVVDSMIGQDAVRTAAEFDRRIGLDGFILTKLDGDARGGAALSIKEVTGKPIKFVGMGEGMDKLEEFRPDGLASRILGMGDVVGLMQDFEKVVDTEKAEEDAEKILKGEFTLYQFLEQIQVIKKMGSLKDLMEKMPFFGGQMPEGMNVDEKELVRIEAIISSMTHKERLEPSSLDGKRMQRIARGSGTTPAQVESLLARYGMMKKTFEAIGKQPGLLSRIPGFKQLAQAKALKGMDMNEMMRSMGGKAGKGGMPMMPGMPGMMPGMAGMPEAKGPARVIDRDKLKKKRKQERQAKKQARKHK